MPYHRKGLYLQYKQTKIINKLKQKTMTTQEIKNRWFELAEMALEEVPQTGSYHTPLCDRVRKGYEWLKQNLSIEEFEEVSEFVNNEHEYELEWLGSGSVKVKESKMAKMHAEYCEAMEIRYDANKRDYVRF